MNLQVLNKSATPALFPVKSIRAVTGVIERAVQVTKGSAGGTDPLGVSVNRSGGREWRPGDAYRDPGRPVRAGTRGPALDRHSRSRTSTGRAGTLQWLASRMTGRTPGPKVLKRSSPGAGAPTGMGGALGNFHLRGRDDRHQAEHQGVMARGTRSSSQWGCGPRRARVHGRHVQRGEWDAVRAQESYIVSGDAISWAPGGPEPSPGRPTSSSSARTRPSPRRRTTCSGGGLRPPRTPTRSRPGSGPGPGKAFRGRRSAASRQPADINEIRWPGYVPNAEDYHVYRSTDGVNFHFLKNTYWDYLVDDGSFTPDPGKTPSTLQTWLNGSTTFGSTTVTVFDTTGFPNSGTAFIGGSDIFHVHRADRVHVHGLHQRLREPAREHSPVGPGHRADHRDAHAARGHQLDAGRPRPGRRDELLGLLRLLPAPDRPRGDRPVQPCLRS